MKHIEMTTPKLKNNRNQTITVLVTYLVVSRQKLKAPKAKEATTTEEIYNSNKQC